MLNIKLINKIKNSLWGRKRPRGRALDSADLEDINQKINQKPENLAKNYYN